MKNELKSRTGGQLLVDALQVHGVDTAFCVPGESYLAVLDALYDAREAIKLIVCRQEGGAANMAEAYGKLTGKPGICMVTRGPGASNAAIGVHTAFQDSTPMILLIGQVGSDFVEREAFQEVDFRRMYGQMAKWVASIRPCRTRARIPESRVSLRHVRAQRAGGAGPARRHAHPDRGGRRHRPLPGGRGASGRRRHRETARAAGAGAAAAGDPRRKRLERQCLRRSAPGSSRRTACRWAALSVSRTCSTTPTPTTPATSASASIRNWRSG